MQPGGEQALDHAVVQPTSNTVPIVEHIQSNLGLDKLGGGREPLGDISNHRDSCLDRSVEGTESNFDGHLVARSMERSHQHAPLHRSSVLAVYVDHAIGNQ